MNPWEGIVKIPAGRVGDHAIEHFTRPPGKVERSNLRTSLCGGQSDPPLVFTRTTHWHRLTYSGGVWMTDLPIEQVQHDIELAPILNPDTGGSSVLVGGLGVGYAANVLAACEHIDRIVIVELSPEVVELVAPHLVDPDGKIEVVTMDLFEYLQRNNDDVQEQFDFGFYDIWQTDSENTFHHVVVPLRELSHEYVGDVICWNENVMRGQLAMALQNRAIMSQLALLPAHQGVQLDPITIDFLATPSGSIWHDWAVPFFEAIRAGEVPGVARGAIAPTLAFLRAAGAYAGTYGMHGWKPWWSLVRSGDVKFALGESDDE